MQSSELKNIGKNAAEAAFLKNDVEGVCTALISVAFYELDWKWAQDKFLHFLDNDNPEIRGLAAICLGHLARIHKKLEKEKVICALRNHLGDDLISGQVEDALSDVEFYLGRTQ